MLLKRIHANRRPAATLVETAAVIVIALLIMFGIFEYGRFVMTKQILENAAREGARWAVVHNNGTTAQVQDAVDQKLGAGRQQLSGYVKTSSITVYAADSNGNAVAGKNWNDAGFGENVAVQITGTYKPALPNLLFMNSSFTISAKSVMASESN